MPVIAPPSVATHALPHAQFTSLATPSTGSRETSVWRVRLEPGAPPAPHVVTREEIFVVLAGTARVTWDTREEDAPTGAAIVVPPHTTFALGSADDRAVELVCCLPVGGQAALVGGEPFTPPWTR